MKIRKRYASWGFHFRHSTFLLFLLFAPGLFAQEGTVPLPTVDQQNAWPPGRLVSHPDSSSQILQAPGSGDMAPPQWPPMTTGAVAPSNGNPAQGIQPSIANSAQATQSEPPNNLPPGVRNGFFQKLLFDATYLPRLNNSTGMGCNDLQLQSVFAMPCPTIQSPLVITPGFAVHYLDGPANVDLPSRLYDSYIDFRWMSQMTPDWGIDLAVAPGVYSDFEQESSKAFRVTAHAALAWTWSERTKIVFGAAYLDRPDAEVIPIGGVVWTPTEDMKFDIVFPHPRISHRLYWSEFCGGPSDPKVEDRLYVAGEFSGDAWAFRRSDGTDDQVVLSDYRAVLGVEHKVIGGLSSHVEFAYVFSRRIRYTSGAPDYRPTDTIMLRAGMSY